MMDDEHSREIARAELLGRLKRAYAEASPLEEVEVRDEAEAELLNAFIRGDLSLADYHAQDARAEMLYRGEMLLSNTDELFEALMLYTHNEGLAREHTDHEVDHVREAVGLGFPEPKILIRFFDDQGKKSFRPAVRLVLPKEGDEDLIRQHVRTIIEAPEEMSDLDTRQIK